MNDLLLLSALLAGPKHGYALKKQIAAMTGQGEMHNNLVYPLMKRFVAKGWVSHRQTAGERGQTRERYALTPKGRQELVRKLSDFPAKTAASAEAFSLRIGLFEILDATTRESILNQREKWLDQRASRLSEIAEAMELGFWPAQVVTRLRAQARLEKKWITRVRRKAQSV